jgi:hypothetical protein
MHPDRVPAVNNILLGSGSYLSFQSQDEPGILDWSRSATANEARMGSGRHKGPASAAAGGGTPDATSAPGMGPIPAGLAGVVVF